ncbi:hypothetical protein SCHPADRAFT_492866 [Schizopora paradoxa]|uniref:Uncharacterized protein n=1 Tax=Schizopora paradoxa TaxID=27342 RepID=A0A0H2S1U2_9AGAM|nr:hypothetical protein SCHPADRAFT_492866 [Schizopora paradoxa]
MNSCANASASMREGSNITVVSDTVDRLEARTVPESALPRNEPTSYTGIHARRRLVPLSVDLRCLHLNVRQLCVDEEESRERTLTRREEMPTAILRLAFGRMCEGARSKLHSDQRVKMIEDGLHTYRRSLIMSMAVPFCRGL